MFYHNEPLSRFGGAGVAGLSAGGWVRTAGCCRGAGGVSDGGGVTSAGGLPASAGAGVVGAVGLSVVAAFGSVVGCVCAGFSAGCGVGVAAGAVRAGGADAGSLFLSLSEPPKKNKPAAATTATTTAATIQIPVDDFLTTGGGVAALG